MMTVECAGCYRPILDQYLLHFLDKTWHSSCVKCQICRRLLDEKCFYKEGKIYCREDFYRFFGPKCAGCGEGILPQDYVRKAREKVYHLRCFTCSLCSKQLSTGEVLYLQPGDDNTLLCKEDYLKNNQDAALFSDEEDDLDDRVSIPGLMDPSQISPHPASGSVVGGGLGISPGSGPGGPIDPLTGNRMETNNNSLSGMDKADSLKRENDDNDSMDGDMGVKEGEDAENKSPDGDGPGGKRRGPRTTIKAKQLEVLKTAFGQTPKPTRHIREQLAKETGLTMRVIQVWFQNKRSKERRMKQMTNGMVAGRGFFPGKGGRRGFPMIGDEFGYFHSDKPYHDFGYPPNFPPPEGFFPGPMGFMGPPGGPNMDQPLPMHGGPPIGPPIGPPMPPGSSGPGGPLGPGGPGQEPFPPSSLAGDFPMVPPGGTGGGGGSGGAQTPNPADLPRPSPADDFQNNSANNSSNGSGFSSPTSDQPGNNNPPSSSAQGPPILPPASSSSGSGPGSTTPVGEQMVW